MVDIRTIRPPTNVPRGFILALVLGVLFVFFWRTAGLITDWFWYREVGYENVFTVSLIAQFKAAALFGIPYFLFFFLNLTLANRLAPPFRVHDGSDTIDVTPAKKPLQLLILVVSVVLGLFAALAGAGQWESLLLFCNGTPFGVNDPLFGKDIGFYVFQLPFLGHLFGWFVSLNLFTLVATAVVYVIRKAAFIRPPQVFSLAPAARRHLLILLSFFFFWGVFGSWLSLNEVLFTRRGVVFGPGYTDVTTQLWVLKALMAVSFLCGAAIVAYAFVGKALVPIAAVGAFAALFILGRGVYPSVVQKFQVIPNEIVLERPYIEWNIRYTRLAYQLDNIEERDFPAEENLTREDLRRNDLTIKNI
ncbi:MAG TPA: UPF0182 family protein, partial [Syntrophales bacterium]|nr:UPF0182 family protein [Syntrophales bacterium]